ncbi:hypothetical protein HS088_TW05G00505 [Tripterygium wilfordii]|uniref:Uncharacterized protein n=1 Tax=Tripterygium wilfordii TaxID=458696 RepID=A0A7J7DN64_TRIWF|nr:hypothetical protein HS088_TW05G00505 [Tripterygium wilfordii]
MVWIEVECTISFMRDVMSVKGGCVDSFMEILMLGLSCCQRHHQRQSNGTGRKIEVTDELEGSCFSSTASESGASQTAWLTYQVIWSGGRSGLLLVYYYYYYYCYSLGCHT